MQQVSWLATNQWRGKIVISLDGYLLTRDSAYVGTYVPTYAVHTYITTYRDVARGATLHNILSQIVFVAHLALTVIFEDLPVQNLRNISKW